MPVTSTVFNLDGWIFFWEFLGRFQSDDNDKNDNNNNNNNDNKSDNRDNNNNKDTSFHSFQFRLLKFFFGVPGIKVTLTTMKTRVTTRITTTTTKTLASTVFNLDGWNFWGEIVGRFHSDDNDKSDNNNNNKSDNKDNNNNIDTHLRLILMITHWKLILHYLVIQQQQQ